MSSKQSEPWLRGPVPGIPLLLQPAAHAFLMAQEDVVAAVDALTADDIWERPGGIASVGFHVAHLAGSTERLLTYARDESLTELQAYALARERTIDTARPPIDELLADWRRVVTASLGQLASTPEADLLDPRFVGRARLPSTVLGLLFHAAEHAARHTGQIVTTAKLLRARRDANRE
jgi:uncharacterized damage-inducible protein DinB